MERHIDYVHDNPVKHGYVRCPVEWQWSSFHRWVNNEAYPRNWGCTHLSPQLKFDDIEKSVGE